MTESRRQIEERLEVTPAKKPRWERNAQDPEEVYDVRVDGRLVAQVLRDDATLPGEPATRPQWVVVQKDHEYVLSAQDRDEALAAGRRFVAERLGAGPDSPPPQAR